MPSLLSLIDFSLGKEGATADFQLAPGRSMAVMGPAGGGKSFFIECLMGREAPRRGFARTATSVAEAGLPGGRRLRPQAIAQKGPGQDRATPAADALIALGLWDSRQTSIEKLSSGQRTACELLGPLASRATLMVVDGHLDHLDPWTLGSAWTLIKKRLGGGAGLVAADCDDLIVFRDQQVRYCGSVEQLLASEPSEVTVESFRSEAVKGLAEPLGLSFSATPAGLVTTTSDGPDVAARLLLAGYGDVRATVLRAPTLDQVIARF